MLETSRKSSRNPFKRFLGNTGCSFAGMLGEIASGNWEKPLLPNRSKSD
jgi:hypothetical protein